VPWAPFFPLCVFWVVGTVPACDSAMGVMSDAKPGIRILWLRSVSVHEHASQIWG
jgi:hypothetical protein